MGEVYRRVWPLCCVLKSGCRNLTQHAVRSAYICIAVAKAVCRFGLVGNCIFLLVQIGEH